MYCPNCGKELPEDAQFCFFCGNSISSPMDTETEETENNVRNLGTHDILFNEYDPTVRLPKISTDSTRRTKSAYKKPIIISVVAVTALIVVMALVMAYLTLPSRIKETGEYTLSLHDAVAFDSIGSTIEFQDVIVDEPNYETLTTTVHFRIKIYVPRGSKTSTYSKWLTDFTINASSTSYAVELFDMDEKYVIYEIPYSTTYTDRSYMIKCKVNKNLTLNFVYDKSFWDLEEIDKDTAIAVGQRIIDEEYDITYVSWQDGGNKQSYSEGKLYRMTGKIASCGQYMWGLTDMYYITLIAVNSFFDAHCYFSTAEWMNNVPFVEAGDIVSFYGYFDFEMLGWNFENCTFISPAGTYTINENGEPEIKYGSGDNGNQSNNLPNTSNPSSTETPVPSVMPDGSQPTPTASGGNTFPPAFTPIAGYSDHLGEYIDEYGRVLVVSVGTDGGVFYSINIYANQSDANNYTTPLLEASYGTMDYHNGAMVIAFEDSSGNGLYFERDNWIEDNYTLYVHGDPYVGGCDVESYLGTTFYMTAQYIDPMG